MWLKVTKGYTWQKWGRGLRVLPFFSNFDAIIDKSIVFIYVRKMKGHLDLRSLRGEKFHISAARQMSSCDMYRDISPEIFPSPDFFSFWEGNIERKDSAFFITHVSLISLTYWRFCQNWVMWYLGWMSPPCTFVCIHASQPVMPGWVEGGVTWKHRQFMG